MSVAIWEHQALQTTSARKFLAQVQRGADLAPLFHLAVALFRWNGAVELVDRVDRSVVTFHEMGDGSKDKPVLLDDSLSSKLFRDDVNDEMAATALHFDDTVG